MIDPTGTTVWTTQDPGSLVSIPLNPLGDGTVHTLTGNDTTVSTIAWRDSQHVYYTSSNYPGYGHFGTIDLSTFSTRCVMNSTTNSCQIFPAAHGMTYDSFTSTIIIFGATQITQIDPNNLSVISNLIVKGAQFDQGTVDGKGHLFVASNAGQLFFLDYALSGKVGDPSDYSNNTRFALALDDVAPLVGPGGTK